jgi:hypothetical protein
MPASERVEGSLFGLCAGLGDCFAFFCVLPVLSGEYEEGFAAPSGEVARFGDCGVDDSQGSGG